MSVKDHILLALAIVISVSLIFLSKDPETYAQQNPLSQPLLQSNNLSYLGAFKTPTLTSQNMYGATKGFSYAPNGLTYNPANNSLFINNDQLEQKTTEISIPNNISTNLAALPSSTVLQNFGDITEGNRSNLGAGGAPISTSGEFLGGLMVYKNKLYGTAYGYYDASYRAALSHFSSSLNLTQSGDFRGMYKVGTLNPGFYSGYMIEIPSEWRSLFGGPALTGNCCTPIVSRTSYGPSAFVFDPEDLGVKDPVPAQPVLYYDSAHQTLGRWDNMSTVNTYYNMTTGARNAVFPAGTRSLLFIGSQGLGIPCYGVGTTDSTLHLQQVPTEPAGVVYCYDPANSSKGNHAYPYKHWVWAYDAADLLSVKNGQKNPWDLRPYTMWELPLTPIGGVQIQGVAYDPSTQRIFVAQKAGIRLTPNYSAYDYSPLIHVFQVNNATPVPTPPPAYPGYPTYPAYQNTPPTYPNYPNYPSYPAYPNTPPTYPNYPSYPNNPTYPTYPDYPNYPGYPAQQIPADIVDIGPVDVTYTDTTATIRWTTSRATNAQIEYGQSLSFGSLSSLDSSQTTQHSITLTSLLPSTRYFFKIKSADSNGNLAPYGNSSFTTGAQSAAPVTTPTYPSAQPSASPQQPTRPSSPQSPARPTTSSPKPSTSSSLTSTYKEKPWYLPSFGDTASSTSPLADKWTRVYFLGGLFLIIILRFL